MSLIVGVLVHARSAGRHQTSEEAASGVSPLVGSPRSELAGGAPSAHLRGESKKALISSVAICMHPSGGTQKEPALQTHTARAACPWFGFTG